MNTIFQKARSFLGYPFYRFQEYIRGRYRINHEMELAERLFKRKFDRKIDWENPKDLNEKILWLKFHEDQHKWANLADKILARKYVEERGLKEILIPLYKQWDSAKDVMADWNELPEEFVLKSNNGCGRVIVINSENGGKENADLQFIKSRLRRWQREKDYGVLSTELHYQFIKNSIYAEKLLPSDDVSTENNYSLVDYKIWCFNGEPYGCLVVVDRQGGNKKRYFDYYDLNWTQRTDLLNDKTSKPFIPKPENWDRMLEYASILSSGIPQVRVDLYNIHGEIFFGEMTFTSACGFNDRYSNELLYEMGSRITLDYSMPWNEFAEKKKNLSVPKKI